MKPARDPTAALGPAASPGTPAAPPPDPADLEIPGTGRGGWILASVLGLAAFALYLATLSPSAFPGLPANLLARHCFLDTADPPLLDPLWGWLVRTMTAWSPANPARWPNLFSAFCGGLAVFLLSALVVRLRYYIPIDAPASLYRRERLARLLAAFSAGIYLTCSVPFWIAANRSLPATFHLLLILLVLFAFSSYQRTGSYLRLVLVGVLAGAGGVETTTLFLLFPLFPAIIARHRFSESQAPFLVPVLLLGFSFLLSAAGAWALLVHVHSATGAAALAGIETPWALFVEILKSQARLVTQIQFTVGLPILFSVTGIPWLFLFLFSYRSPTSYEWAESIGRFLFLGVLVLVLFNSMVSPWNYLGMTLFLVAPYAIMAACAGYAVGELVLIAYPRPADTRFTRFARRLALLAVAAALPAIAASAFTNIPITRGNGGALPVAADAILRDRPPARDVILSAGAFDNPLRLLLRARRENVLVVTVPKTSSPAYNRSLAPFFEGQPAFSAPLEQGNFGTFIAPFLLDEAGLSRTASIEFEHVLRAYGYPASLGLLTCIYPTPAEREAALGSLFAANRGFWERIRPLLRAVPHEKNPSRPYFDHIASQASKHANDFALVLASADPPRLPEAVEALRAAADFRPANIAPVANLLILAAAHPGLLPDGELDALRDRFQHLELSTPAPSLYNAAFSHGYLLAPDLGDGTTRLWMYSGVPSVPENAEQLLAGDPAEAERKARLRRLVLFAHYDAPPSVPLYALAPRLVSAYSFLPTILALARNAIASCDFDAAGVYLAQAEEHGASPFELALDRALLDYARGNAASALQSLLDLANQAYSDLRVWLAIATVVPPESPLYDQAISIIAQRRGRNPLLYLATANLHLARNHLDSARRDINAALDLDPREPRFWEFILDIDERQHATDLRNQHLDILLAFNPNHPYRFNAIANDAFAAGDYPLAQDAFQKALLHSRNATTLVQYASFLLRRTDAPDPEEALRLLDEALLLVPDHTDARLLRARANIALSRFPDALKDLDAFLDLRPSEPSARLLRALLLAKTGNRPASGAEIPFLWQNRARLSREEVRRLRLLRNALPPSLVPPLDTPPATTDQHPPTANR